jgi:hypothetical protein
LSILLMITAEKTGREWGPGARINCTLLALDLLPLLR